MGKWVILLWIKSNT